MIFGRSWTEPLASSTYCSLVFPTHREHMTAASAGDQLGTPGYGLLPTVSQGQRPWPHPLEFGRPSSVKRAWPSFILFSPQARSLSLLQGSRCHAFQRLHIEESRSYSRSKVYKGGRQLSMANLSNSHHRLIASSPQRYNHQYSSNKNNTAATRPTVTSTGLKHQFQTPVSATSHFYRFYPP